MSTVEVSTDYDVVVAQADNTEPVVVLSPDDVETIATGEQGPPTARTARWAARTARTARRTWTSGAGRA